MLSIIMSVYNNEKTLSLTLESVLSQTYRSFEFIIVDDGSVDIIKEYQKKDERIVFIQNESNLGLPKSLNRAKYDYISRIDGDDICMFDRLEKQIAYMKENPTVDILGTGAILINQQGLDVGEVFMPQFDDEIKNTIVYKNPMIHPSIVMKKSVLKELGGYDEKHKI